MLIVLNGADFSANNIGKYELPKELSQFTLDAIEASGKVMSDEQKYALESFFQNVGAIDNNGIWSKLDKVYIPFICDDLSKALVNYKDNAVDTVLNSNYLQLKSGGVCVSGSENVNASDANNIINGVSLDIRDFSVFMMNTEDLIKDGVLTGTQLASCIGDGTTNSYSVCDVRYNASRQLFLRVSYNNNKLYDAELPLQDNGVLKTLYGVSADGNNVVFMSHGTTTSIPYISRGVANTTTFYPFGVNYAGVIVPRFKPCGVVILGKSMTAEEMLMLQTLVVGLYEYFE